MSEQDTAPSAENAGPSKTEILQGGADVGVTYKNEASETVKVRILEIAEYPGLLKIIDNEPASLECYCQRPAGWAATLSAASHELLIAEAERLNGDFFWRWADRRVKRQERLMPKAFLGKVAEAAAAVSTSSTSSPKLPARPRSA